MNFCTFFLTEPRMFENFAPHDEILTKSIAASRVFKRHEKHIPHIIRSFLPSTCEEQCRSLNYQLGKYLGGFSHARLVIDRIVYKFYRTARPCRLVLSSVQQMNNPRNHFPIYSSKEPRVLMADETKGRVTKNDLMRLAKMCHSSCAMCLRHCDSPGCPECSMHFSSKACMLCGEHFGMMRDQRCTHCNVHMTCLIEHFRNSKQTKSRTRCVVCGHPYTKKRRKE